MLRKVNKNEVYPYECQGCGAIARLDPCPLCGFRNLPSGEGHAKECNGHHCIECGTCRLRGECGPRCMSCWKEWNAANRKGKGNVRPSQKKP